MSERSASEFIDYCYVIGWELVSHKLELDEVDYLLRLHPDISTKFFF